MGLHRTTPSRNCGRRSILSAIILSIIVLGLIILLCFAVVFTAFYHIVVLQVPYVPTPRKTVRKMVKLAKMKKGDVVYDLGAGDGRFLIAAKRICPGIIARGVEYVPTIWLLGWLNIFISRKKIEWRLGDALKQNLRDADVIFLYTGPALMQQLEKKFNRELRRGTRVISHVFQFKKHKPERKVSVPWFRSTKTVQVYQW